ncbi:hypothetical protein AnigIFM56816_005933, partial [Aspergillus niger]
RDSVRDRLFRAVLGDFDIEGSVIVKSKVNFSITNFFKIKQKKPFRKSGERSTHRPQARYAVST